MMKKLSKTLRCLIAGVSAVLLFSGNSSASILGGSSGVPGFGNDDGAALFNPENVVISVELYDLLGASTTTAFGFYFAGADLADPSNLISLFGPDDQTVGSDVQSAVANFGTGVVLDIDDNGFQSLFPSQAANIGFFMVINSSVFFTDPALNPGGVDLAGTFPSLADPSVYLIGFEDVGTGTLLSLDYVDGVNAVPVPGGVWLLGAALLGLRPFVRKDRVG